MTLKEQQNDIVCLMKLDDADIQTDYLPKSNVMEAVFNENEEILSIVIEAARDAIVVLDGHANVCFWNGAAEKLFGYSWDEIRGKELHRLIVLGKHEYDIHRNAFQHFQANGKGKAIGNILELKAKRKDGQEFDIELSVSAFRLKNTWYSVGIVRDISDRKIAKKELENSLKKYLELTEEAPIGIISCDNDGKINYVNNKVLEILGSNSVLETKKINLLDFPLLVKHGFSEKLRECLRNNKSAIYEINYESKWGKKTWLRTHIKPQVSINSVVGAQIIIDDISEKKQLEEELLLLSITDTLTKVYNRRYFLQILEKEIERVNRTNSSFSVIMIDIDHFKHINDCFGHNTGDSVLQTIASEMVKSLRKMDTLARWGGEEFIILLPETTIDKAILIAEKLRNILMMTKIPDVGNVTASFGVVGYNTGYTADQIVHNADSMMYKAKLEGRNRIRFVKE